MKRSFIRNLPTLLLCAVLTALLSACSASPALDKGGYFFRVEEGTAFQSGGGYFEDGSRQALRSYEFSRVECDLPVYCLLARDTTSYTNLSYLYLCSEAPFYLELDQSDTYYETAVSDDPVVVETTHRYSGINRFEVDGRVWYVSDYRYGVDGLEFALILPDTLVSDTAREAPYYSDDHEDTFLHYLREALAGA